MQPSKPNNEFPSARGGVDLGGFSRLHGSSGRVAPAGRGQTVQGSFVSSDCCTQPPCDGGLGKYLKAKRGASAAAIC